MPGVTTFPLLNLDDGVLGTRAGNPIVSGSTIGLTPASGFQADGQSLYACFPTNAAPLCTQAAQTDSGYSATVPEGINGQAYVVLTNQDGCTSDQCIVAGPAVLQITN